MSASQAPWALASRSPISVYVILHQHSALRFANYQTRRDKIRNSSGPKTEPCRTPLVLVTDAHTEELPLTVTFISLFDRKA